MKLSIIIPVYNEEATLGKLLAFLKTVASPETEIIVADGGSTDKTTHVARQHSVQVLHSPKKGRGAQMNLAAAAASGQVLYFLHADTFPPSNFEASIKAALQRGCGSGCFRLQFDVQHWFLQANAWFTRFNINAIRFGDQSLFVRRDVFVAAGGFDEQLLLLEDQEIIIRLRQRTTFAVLPQAVITSARKYSQHGVYRLQASYLLIYTLYRLGVRQKRLLLVYNWLLKKA